MAKEEKLVQTTNGMMQDIIKRFELDAWIEKLNTTRTGLAAACFAGGFAIGFLFKRYFKFLFFTCLIAFGAILFLHYKNMVIVDWVALTQYVGLDPEQIRLATAIDVTWHWVTHHSLIAISATSGFIIGYKLA